MQERSNSCSTDTTSMLIPENPKSIGHPLSIAAERGHLEVVKLLLEQWDSDVEAKDKRHKWLPAWFAYHNGHEEVYRLLEAAKTE